MLNGNMPTRPIAVSVGKPYHQILMREINPDDLDAKLGIETFMVIIDTTSIVCTRRRTTFVASNHATA